MAHCTEIESLIAPYVDDEASAAERDDVERHIRRCAPCQRLLDSGLAARRLLVDHAPALRATTAPPALKARLASLAVQARTPRTQVVRARLVRLAVAASLVVGCGLWLTALVTRQSTTVLAAQLTADHVKCSFTNHDHGMLDPQDAAAFLRERYDFAARVPAGDESLGLRLVGARRCLSGEGTNAHLLYTWRGQSVSLYMLPGGAHGQQGHEVLGHAAEMWPGHNGTYVLVASGDGGSLAPLVDHMRRATE